MISKGIKVGLELKEYLQSSLKIQVSETSSSALPDMRAGFTPFLTFAAFLAVAAATCTPGT